VRVELQQVSAGLDPAQAILQNFSLRIEKGEHIALIGPSGAGKTTLLHLLGLALAPHAGQVLHGDRDYWAARAPVRHQYRAQVMIAPQTPPLPPRQRVVTAIQAARLAYMGFWASMLAWLAPRDLVEVRNVLAEFDLADKLFERVDRLSGGERQRVGLARLAWSLADLWLVDEPLAALDPVRARQAMQVMTGLARQREVTLVASFHQVELALEFFPRVIGLREGKVFFDAAPKDIRQEDVAALFENEKGL
jgi:phosphonate transport system ATP-binding protein